MASPQKEQGYTPIANEILDRIACVPLSGGELRVVMFIIRKTYGFQKKRDRIALSQFVEATQYQRRNLIYLIQQLEAKRIIIVEREEHGGEWSTNSYGLNKDYEQWDLGNVPDAVLKNRRKAKRRSKRLRSGKRVDKGVNRVWKVVQNFRKGSARVLH